MDNNPEKLVDSHDDQVTIILDDLILNDLKLNDLRPNDLSNDLPNDLSNDLPLNVLSTNNTTSNTHTISEKTGLPIYVDTVNSMLREYVGQTITGQKLNELLNGMPLLKFMHDSDIHYGMHYVTGHNLDVLAFNGSGNCCKGGLYVTTLTNYAEYYSNYGNYARRVRIDPLALVYVENHKLKCDEIFLEEKETNDELLKKLYNEYIQSSVDQKSNEISEKFVMGLIDDNPCCVKYIDKKSWTPGLLVKVVRLDYRVLDYIDKESRTPELLMEAVKQDVRAMFNIDKESRTPELLMEAIKRDYWMTLRHFIDKESRTPELLEEALKQCYGNKKLLPAYAYSNANH